MTVWVEIGGKTRRVVLASNGSFEPDGGFKVDDVAVAAEARLLEPGVISLLVEGRSYRCVSRRIGETTSVVIDGEVFAYAVGDPRSLRSLGGGARGGTGGIKTVKAPMPGRVVRVLVQAGDTVEAGQACVVIEAMKMQNELKAAKAGVVSKVSVAVDQTVAAGEVLLVIE
jgi:biotin carboxyl carrier protein